MKSTKLTLWDAAFAVVVVAFVIFKIPYLSLAYFWDESWSYAPALYKMAENGVSLMPGAVPADNYRGHPTLFYALGGAWLKIFGPSHQSFHSFPMVFSVAALTTIYAFGRRFFSPIVGLAAALLLIPQSYFLVQSSMGLPEIALTFWMFLALYFFFQKRWWGYVFAASCLVMTKETGVVLIATLLLGWFIECSIKMRSTMFHTWFVDSCRIAAPLLPFTLFFSLQKMKMGWFLFPEHVDFMVSDWAKFTSNFTIVFDCIFLYDERHVVRALFFIGFIFLIGIAIWKRDATDLKKVVTNRILGYLLLFFVIFLPFSAFNVFIPRYVICSLPIITLLSAYIFYEGLFKNKWLTMLVSIVISGYLFQWTIKQKDYGDVDWGMYDALKVQTLGVQWFEQNTPLSTHIAVGDFLARVHLQDPKTGCLSTQNNFPNAKWDVTSETVYIVDDNLNADNRIAVYKSQGKIELVQHFQSGLVWYDIYKFKK